MKKILNTLILLFPLLCGCVVNDVATKEDVSEIQGNLQARQMNMSEEILHLKRDISQLQSESEDSSKQSTSSQQESNNNIRAVASKINTFESKISNIEDRLSKIQTQTSKHDSQLQSLQNQLKEVQTQRNSDTARLEQKIKIILEEVSKENERIMGELNRSRRPAQTSAVASSDGTYVVQPGENLSSIAVKFGVSKQELSTLNNIANPNSLRAGQKLKIPKK